MTKFISKRQFLAFSASATALAGSAFASPPTASLRPVLRGNGFFRKSAPSIEAILSEARLGGKLSFAVADTSTRRQLEVLSETLSKPPASVTKAITALYALDALGPDHRFETTLRATGGVVNGEVQGDLILAGGGDPTLDTDGLAQLAAELKAAGVHSVRGGFKVYHGALPSFDGIDDAQPDHVGYNPGISGIALNYNRVHFEWRKSNGDYTVTMDARTKKLRPNVVMATMEVHTRDLPVYTYRSAPRRDHWTVARGALGNGGARWLPIKKPAIYAADVFATVARSHGIRLKRAELVNTLPDSEVVATLQSRPVRTIAKEMLRYSTNLTAEMLGLAATQKRHGTATSLKASAEHMNDWAKANLKMSAPAFVDHSGLGDASQMSASDMVTALLAVKDQGLRDILKPIAMRDAQRKIIKDHPISVHAKTGTLNFVSTLAGYMTAPDGSEMAFAILAADEDIRATIKRADRERPNGGRSWNRRAKRAQQALIERWGLLYGTKSSG